VTILLTFSQTWFICCFVDIDCKTKCYQFGNYQREWVFEYAFLCNLTENRHFLGLELKWNSCYASFTILLMFILWVHHFGWGRNHRNCFRFINSGITERVYFHIIEGEILKISWIYWLFSFNFIIFLSIIFFYHQSICILMTFSWKNSIINWMKCRKINQCSNYRNTSNF
jgi:hypothetical protein